MPKLRFRHAFVAVLLLVSMLAQGTWALAGTTGGLSGSVRTPEGAPVAGATVTVSSPSGGTSTKTDNSGSFTFLTLAPDSYTLSVTKPPDYQDQSIAGITVFADQVQTLAITMPKALKTIASVRSNAAGNLVKSGTTSDVYSVNAATQAVVAGNGGGFNLNSAYSAVYSQPGVTSAIGNYGWGQVFYIRGSSYNQIGYEFDGVPVNRAFDNYQADSLSNLGQQELQVYTGGSPSGSSSATLGGFINQVIKTGTYPGSGTIKAGIGGPGFYHGLTAEAGGASPDRNFSYYAGFMGFNQHFPYGTYNNLNNVSYDGQNSYGFTAPAESDTLYYALCGGIQCLGVPAPFGNYTTPADNGNFKFFYGNGPWPACSQKTGLPSGQVAPSGTFQGACLGYGPYGNGYLSDIYERDNVINLHFGIPHKHDGGKDDLQLLWDNSMQYQVDSSSINDNGGLAMISGFLTQFAPDSSAAWAGTPYAGLCGEQNDNSFGCASTNSPLAYIDAKIYAPGTQFGQNASTATLVPYYFPNSPQNRQLNNPISGVNPSGLPTGLRDGFWNDVGIVKAQFTKNIGSNAYARLLGYTFYSDWQLSGPDCAQAVYADGLLNSGLCGQTPDYELSTHTRGAEFVFADQINAQNLVRLTANYTTAGVSRFNNGTFRSGLSSSRKGLTSWTSGDPNNPICYRYTGSSTATFGVPYDCFSSRAFGTFDNPMPNDPNTGQSIYQMCANPTFAAQPGCVALAAGKADWKVTTPGGQGTYNIVKPVFTSLALEDEFRPTSRIDLNLGLRAESYTYDLQNINNPEFNFWFNAAAKVFCYDPATGLPQLTPLAPGQPVPQSPVETAHPLQACGPAASGQEGLHPVGNTASCDNVTTFDCGPIAYTANSPSSFTRRALSPRIGGTYTMGPNDVFRFSLGKYTQPTETAFEQYSDQSGKRAAAFDFASFWGLGFHTPAHDNPIQYSNNYDFSLEHHFRGTDLSMKVSPFYRDTHNQVVTLVLGPGFVGGANYGHQHSYGVELAVSKGDPSRDGLSGGLSYTYTKALLQYQNLPNGTNAIDFLNNYVKAFNALTQAGGGSPCYDPTTKLPNGANSPSSCAAATAIANPYYNLSQQQLLDRSGWYDSYPNEPPNNPTDQGGSTAIAPNQISGWLQWKHNKLAIAPNFQVVGGTKYGSPTDTFGLDPRYCGQNQAAAVTSSPIPAGDAQNPDFLSCGATGYTNGGYLAIPNPYTGIMDRMAQFTQPYQVNIGAQIRYEISPKVLATLDLTNIFNTCFGGRGNAWQAAYKPNNYVCGYGQNNTSYIGPLKGQSGFGGGFYYGDSPSSAPNGSPVYAPAYNYPFAPGFGAIPFQAYLNVQIKL